MRKFLVFLLATLFAFASVALAGAPVFHDVTVTAASGGPLVGSPGNVESVTVKTLTWTGSQFEANVDGETWLFEPGRCLFTLPSGERIVPVFGKDAQGKERWLIGVSPAEEPKTYDQRRWADLITGRDTGNMNLKFPAVFVGAKNVKRANDPAILIAEYEIQAKARKAPTGEVIASEVTVVPIAVEAGELWKDPVVLAETDVTEVEARHEKLVARSVSKIVTDTYYLDFRGWRAELEKVRPDYTESGWREMRAALEPLIREIMDKRLLVSASVKGETSVKDDTYTFTLLLMCQAPLDTFFVEYQVKVGTAVENGEVRITKFSAVRK